MSIFKRLFGSKGEAPVVPPVPEAMRGGGDVQSKEEQDATRVRMENEMAGQKARRDESAAGEEADKG